MPSLQPFHGPVMFASISVSRAPAPHAPFPSRSARSRTPAPERVGGPQKPAPPPQPAAAPTAQPGLWLWTRAARQGAQESDRQPVHVLLTETGWKSKQKKPQKKGAPEFSPRWRAFGRQTEKRVVHKTRGNRAMHRCLNDTARALTPNHDSCLPCECIIQMFHYQICVYCRTTKIGRRSRQLLMGIQKICWR